MGERHITHREEKDKDGNGCLVRTNNRQKTMEQIFQALKNINLEFIN